VVPVPPPPEAPVPPVVPVGAGVVPVEPPPVVPVEAPEEGVVPLGPELVELEVVEVVLVVELVAGATEPDGTVNGGAPEVSVDPEPPPQPAAPTASAAAARIPIAVRGLRARWVICSAKGSGPERLHSPAAMWAVVEILLCQLVAPVAEAKVIDPPRKLRGGWREREQHPDHLERLARLAVGVHPSGLGLDHNFATGGGRAHPVLLARPHRPACYQRQGRDRWPASAEPTVLWGRGLG
jgi:hypothetical protein